MTDRPSVLSPPEPVTVDTDQPGPLVENPDRVRLAMLGATKGNGHPYSWSAIINGYDPDVMRAECPFPAIPGYLGQQPQDVFPVAGARITHVHCEGDGGFTAESVARAALVPKVVARATDVIGEVDAVVIATDRGTEHLERARPFVEAGIPVFIDKPLVTDVGDLAVFRDWVAQGRAIMSSSSMRWTKEFQPYHRATHELGKLRLVTIACSKSWEAYGIHAVEAVYPIVGPGFQTVRNIGAEGNDIVHLRHSADIDVIASVRTDLGGSFGALQLCGTDAMVQTRPRDTFHSFRSQLLAFLGYLRTGVPPFPFAETEELMRIIIAGIVSRQEGGRVVRLSEFDDIITGDGGARTTIGG